MGLDMARQFNEDCEQCVIKCVNEDVTEDSQEHGINCCDLTDCDQIELEI